MTALDSRPLWCERCGRSHTFYRPTQAAPDAESWGSVLRRSWPEALAGVVILLVLFAALAYLPMWLS